ncbi:ubiquitin related modifier 1 [Coprinopsis marcescibilis]|uniref:Ubiquitin-related modifier 1 n=1 Tax=Coprinopsis marcescibilis TaxID=230819 RepID=A0A5C3L913_COPMA|nr:ubiquitin related modifier 1 [Coprinopsis marcescibilis]
MASQTPPNISLKIEFSGGLELLFSNQRSHKISIPSEVPKDNNTRLSPPDGSTKPADISYLVYYLRDHLLQERGELFEEDGTVRPGILVLVNDTDWELEGEGDYVLKDGDEIVFISTLHGG